MRVGVDMYFAMTALASAGIGNYSTSHLAHLGSHADVELIYFQPNYQGMTAERYREELSRFIVDNEIDVFHLTSPFHVPYPEVLDTQKLPRVALTATVYDVIPYIYSQIYLADANIREMWHRQVEMLQRTQQLLAISEYTRKDFLRIGFAPDRVTTIGTGVGESYFVFPDADLADFQDRFRVSDPYVLGFNVVDFRKNANRLTEAFAQTVSNQPASWQLVFVGDAPSEVQQNLRFIAAAAGKADSVFFVGRVSQAQLLRLYNRAQFVAFPSLYEGLGLPVLEAMQCGTPVVTAHTSSLPEVVNDAAILVNPESVASIAAGLRQLITNESLCHVLAHRGLARVQNFSWADVTARSLSAFRIALSRLPAKMDANIQVQLPAAPGPTWSFTIHKSHGRMTVRLAPNRYCVLERPGKSSVTYVSFNLQEIPDNTRLIRAILRAPMPQATHGFHIYRVTSSWSVQHLSRSHPKVENSPIYHTHHFSQRPNGEQVYKWKCTHQARRWRKRPLQNHGLLLHQAVSRPPSLAVTYQP